MLVIRPSNLIWNCVIFLLWLEKIHIINSQYILIGFCAFYWQLGVGHFCIGKIFCRNQAISTCCAVLCRRCLLHDCCKNSKCPAAAAAANSLQWCLTLCDPIRRQPTRLLCPWDSAGKNTGVGCHFLLQCMKVKSESEVTQSCLTLHDPMDCSLPGSSIRGIFQARALEWVAIAFSL